MWRASFEHGVGIVDHHPISEQRNYFLSEIVPKARIRVVLDQGMIVGFLAATDWYVAQLYVRVGYLGRGIGTSLLSLAKQESEGSLTLHTFKRNTRACRFYERSGFTAVQYGFEPMWNLEDVKYEWHRGESAA